MNNGKLTLTMKNGLVHWKTVIGLLKTNIGPWKSFLKPIVDISKKHWTIEKDIGQTLDNGNEHWTI